MSHSHSDIAIETDPRASNASVGMQTPDIVDDAMVGQDNVHVAIVIIERRLFVRECLARDIGRRLGCRVRTFPDVASWLEAQASTSASLIVFCALGASTDSRNREDISLLAQSRNDVPTVVLSDEEDIDHVMNALECGARGLIPTSVSLDVALEAMRLVQVGGVFIPADGFLATRRPAAADSGAKDIGAFTARQIAVVDGLRQGKANKLIAYELNMRESTVKVHVRNIMKKLQAKNRTEVAVKAGELMQENGTLSRLRQAT